MRKIRTALTAVATLSMVLATTGAAFAQGSSSWESRADFIFQLDKSLGIQPVYPATPDFQDVSTSSPYYGYIEAAYQDGITNGIAPGIFGPSLGITRAEAAKYLVIAFGAGAAAQNITSTTFSDNGDIPTALVGYVGEAAAIGLMKGFPDGTFNPEGNLTVTQEGYLLSQLTTAISSLTLTVTASSSDVAPGQPVTLQTSAASASGAVVASPIVTYSVTGTNAGDAIIAGNTFVGSTAGNYTVQASSGTATGATTVGVYGSAAGLKVSAPTTVVANGLSTTKVTVDVVDANGNVVGNNTDQLDLSTDTNAAAAVVDGSGSVAAASFEVSANAANGVATFTIQSGTVAGATTTLTAEDDTTADPSEYYTSAAVAATAQVPTSLAVSAASPYLTANGSNSDQLSAKVLDQTGSPLLSGAYTVSFAVTSGPATFSSGATAAGVYYGPTKASATATLDDVQGSTGAIVVTASASGLTSGTANVTAVIAGAPAQLAISAGQTLTADTASLSGATYTLTLEDSQGYPADATSAVTVAVTDSSGVNPPAATIPVGSDTTSFKVGDKVAGSYTLTAAATGLTSGTSTETVTPGTPAVIVATPNAATSPTNVYVPVSSPSFTVSAQLEDAEGNAVSEAGVPITFDLTAGPNTGTATINGASTGTSTVVTNASGVATATVAAQGYQGDSYSVTASSSSVSLSGQTPTIVLGQNVTASSTITVTDSSTNVVSSMVSGGSYTGTIKQVDTYGNPVVASGDTLLITLSGTGTAALGGGAVPTATPGVYTDTTDTFTITPKLAGSLTISVQDQSVYNAPTASGSFAVTPGTDVAGVTFSSGGIAISSTAPLATTAGTAYPITVTATDAGGNPVVAASTVPVVISTTNAGGEFRLGSASGANEAGSNITVNIPAGQSSATVYYVASGTSAYFDGSTVAYTVTGTPATATGISTPVTVTFTVTNANGADLSGVTVTVSDGGAGGSFASSAGVTNSSGSVSFTYTTPSSGTADTVTATVRGASSTSPSVTGITGTAAVSY